MIMSVHTVRRLAADLLGVGENRIRINSANMSEVLSAMTRVDVQGLIDKKVVKAIPKKGRRKKEHKRRRSEGSVRGKRGDLEKKEWMKKVRAQRKFLKTLLALKALEGKNKRAIYMKVKSGIFRSKRAMLVYLKENGFVNQTFEVPKQEKVEKPKPKKVEKKVEMPKQEKKGETK